MRQETNFTTAEAWLIWDLLVPTGTFNFKTEMHESHPGQTMLNSELLYCFIVHPSLLLHLPLVP